MRDPRRELASPSAARLSGDDYQHVFTLMQAARLLREDVWGVQRVAMEVDGAGNVDDLIVFYRDRPTVYHQIKFARRAGEPLDHTWFSDPGGARKSPLQRFHKSFETLAHGGIPPEMALVTNRAIAAGDPILRHLEGTTALLTPRLSRAEVPAETRTERAEWAKHLGISEKELFEMLDHLRVHAGAGTLELLRERCGEVMMAAGLRGDANAVILGNGAIRELIEAGHDELDLESMRELVERHDLAAQVDTALLDVAAIDRSPFATTATASLDWVERYEGSAPRERRRLLDSAAAGEMAAELGEARSLIQDAGYSDLTLRGAFRLDVGFALGAEFADTAGFQLSIPQRDQVWDSKGERAEFDLESEIGQIGPGEELAVCLSISASISDAVSAFVEEEGLAVGQLLDLRPGGRVGRDSIALPAAARGCAQEVLDEVRRHSEGVPRIHLFLAAPNGLAVLIGHIWNRVPPTQLYADLAPGYQPTFVIQG